MVRIPLGESRTYTALDRNRYIEKAKITRETERAYLLEIQHGPVVYKHWIPKSISLRLKSFIEVPDWFWERAAEERRMSRVYARGSELCIRKWTREAEERRMSRVYARGGGPG